ncbi:NRDE family protein [Alcanivorax sp. MM125-6]|nr:NRDE family protein [Alcanivorax sp. MM125-6]
MCIVLFEWRPGADTPLTVAANRDEFHARPTEPARWRGDIFCGLDRRAGGTWLGIHRDGRFAVITNFREPVAERGDGELSRGLLPSAFLQSDATPEVFCRELAAQQHRYAGFNLLVGDRDRFWYLSNRGAPPRAVAPGVHGLSNGLLDDPWPKVERGKARLTAALAEGAGLDALLQVVNDRHQPPDSVLPDTGVNLALERLVAPVFIQSPEYGTRASSAVKLHAHGEPEMAEQSWRPDGEPDGPPRYSIRPR